MMAEIQYFLIGLSHFPSINEVVHPINAQTVTYCQLLHSRVTKETADLNDPILT